MMHGAHTSLQIMQCSRLILLPFQLPPWHGATNVLQHQTNFLFEKMHDTTAGQLPFAALYSDTVYSQWKPQPIHMEL
jgi:hypothetical protein